MRNTTKVYAVAALAGGLILATAGRADAANPACNSFVPSHTIYFAGSSASQPILQALAYQLKQAGVNIGIVYENPSSCVGLNDLLTSGTTEASNPVYMDGSTNPATLTPCDATNGAAQAGSYVDVAVSDVFPATCTTYSNIPMLGSGQKDWWGPAQAMVFAVQKASTETSISAEAAYVVLGWAGQSNNTVSPWTDPTQIFIRKPTSGTQSMISKAIGLPPTKWLAQSPYEAGLPQEQSGSGAVVTALENATNANAALGILSTEFTDLHRDKLRALAFQAKDPNGGDQDCGYLPDSDGTHFDKLNVRQGRYGIWGPLHFVTNVDGSGKAQPNASNTGTMAADVQTLIAYLSFDASLTADQTKAMIIASQQAYVVPPCAMEVGRNDDAGAEMSVAPTGMCGCYYEALAAGTPTNLGMPTSSYCHACTTSADCSGQGNYKTCNYGFCEVQ